MECRFCGCTDRSACPEGCSWFRESVCTSCIDDYVDAVYEDRNLAALGMLTAFRAISNAPQVTTDWNLDIGWREDPEEPGWAIVWATLPAGEVSWHIPEELVPDWLEKDEGDYDGYDREEKNDRIEDWIFGDGDTGE